jgi:hypothetical protein
MLRHERQTAPESEYAKLSDATLQFARLLAGTAYTDIEIPRERVTYIDPPPATIDNGPCEARRQVVRAMHDKARQDRADFRDMLRADPPAAPPPQVNSPSPISLRTCAISPRGTGLSCFAVSRQSSRRIARACARIAYR